MRKRRTWMLCALVLGSLGGCGGGHGTEVAGVGARGAGLSESGWVGGRAATFEAPPRALRALVFLDVRSPRAVEDARRLADLARRHPSLEVVGATTSTDPAAVEAFRVATGFPGSVALGVPKDVLARYGVVEQPALRVVDARGEVVGRQWISLLALLGRSGASGA